MTPRVRHAVVGLLIVAAAGAAGCSRESGDATNVAGSGSGAPTYTEQGCDDDAFGRIRASRSGGAEVTVCGHVVSIAGDLQTRRGLHKHWRLDVRDRHDPIEIDSNEDLEGRFDLAPGDYAVVRGEYYSDPNGREGIHYTHRDPRGRHDDGFVFTGGRLIQ